ncbi:hypothetical protein IAP91_09890 [Leuconostoc mesenteroides]|nr:hypothetical protein [Leuconostoc mesenteroides]
MGTYKGIKLNGIIIILITMIWLIIEFNILSQSRKWRQKLWQISLRKILTVLHVKDSKECFELIDILKHHEEKLSRKKERKRASFSSFSINLLLTILTGIFTITSALLKENYLNPIKAHWSAIMFILINIIMPILFTSIILILFIYRTTQETSFFNESQRINMIVDELYKFNYKKIQKKDHNKNKSKELSVAKQK